MTTEEVQAALWHYVYKNHSFSPTFCSGCEMVQKAIDEYSGTPLEIKWCRPQVSENRKLDKRKQKREVKR